MKIHHLNCATMHPVLPRLTHGKVAPQLQKLVCHCLLVETDAGLVLVDSGFGLADCGYPPRIPGAMRKIGRPNLAEDETAIRQVEALGYAANDVRHVILSHLDLDHAGGIGDFPQAKVHVMAAEHAAAMNPTWREKARYLNVHWEHRPEWVLHTADGEAWNGFECVRDLPGLPPEILLIPLAGHTRGHAAIAVEGEGGWVVHCGDAYFHHTRMAGGKAPFGLSLFERVAAMSTRQMRQAQARLRELYDAPGITLVSAHDPLEFHRCCGDLEQTA